MKLGYPVVLKISSAEVTHKSEVGGVALDLRTEANVTVRLPEAGRADGG